MPNSKKKKNEEILETWTNLKEKINTLLSDLDSIKVNKETIIERYEKKLKEKNERIARLEESDDENGSDFINFRQAVLQEVKLMLRTPINATTEQLLETLKNLRKDYRKLRGLDSGPE